MEYGPLVAATLFGIAALIISAGSIWLGAQYLRQQARREHDLRGAIEHLEVEVSELHERIDFQERLLTKYREVEELGSASG
ncbi:MAG: hypothetical protein GTN78_22145 [Gemmatimonadales bacterium]|nr:hypothetical protein [Gemmatimonadales bacterium]NIN10860.1 hypothetical protein [Gemmatimonadales bacterium]NIR02868.1 hypothetical protein [Gemmatimonadales bacterium]NIS66502.1 hypothetical protein [Gemmatimonadales bacterium]